MKNIVIALTLLLALALHCPAQDTKFGASLARRGIGTLRQSYEVGWLRGSGKVKVSAESVTVAGEQPLFAVVLDSLESEQAGAQTGIVDFDEMPSVIAALDGIAKAAPTLKTQSQTMLDYLYKTRAGVAFGLTQVAIVGGQEQHGVLRLNDKAVFYFPVEQVETMRALITKARDKLTALGAK